MRKKGFTLIELLVVIAIIAMLLAILMPALSKVKKIAQRVICGTNLKGLGTAQTVYANDYDDEYTVQGGRGQHTWNWSTSGFQATAKDWSTPGTITVGASLYLLVREADVSPKSFNCPSGDESAYDGKNANNLDIVELWDFGNESAAADSGYPYMYVSYSYQMPYASGGGKSSRAADGSRSASFAIMADKNPYFDPKISQIGGATSDTWPDIVAVMAPYYEDGSAFTESSWEVKRANSFPHGREGQNILFGDGHSAFEKTQDVGVKHDAVYVPRGTGTTEADVRRGNTSVMTGAPHNDTIQPVGSSDSYLVNDDDQDPTARP